MNASSTWCAVAAPPLPRPPPATLPSPSSSKGAKSRATPRQHEKPAVADRGRAMTATGQRP